MVAKIASWVVRLGGLVMPFRIKVKLSAGVPGRILGAATGAVDCGKKGFRPSLG